MKKLKDIAEIQIGYQHRDRGQTISKESVGSHRIIQIKDINESIILAENLTKINPKGDAERYLVNQDDILFLSRGVRALAILVRAPLKNAIAAYYFYILRVNSSTVLPEYLAWFISQPKAQAYLKSQQKGSHIKMIPKSAVEDLDIDIPSLKVQKTIIDLEKLRAKEEQTMHSIIKARKKLVNGLALVSAKSIQPA